MSSYAVVKQNKNSLAIYNILGPFESYREASDLVKEKREDYADQPHLTFEVWLLDSTHEDLRGHVSTLTFTPDQSLLDRLN